MLENEMGNFTAATNKKDYDMVTTIIITKTNVQIDFQIDFQMCHFFQVDDSCKMAANVMDIDDDNLEADSHIACHR